MHCNICSVLVFACFRADSVSSTTNISRIPISSIFCRTFLRGRYLKQETFPWKTMFNVSSHSFVYCHSQTLSKCFNKILAYIDWNEYFDILDSQCRPRLTPEYTVDNIGYVIHKYERIVFLLKASKANQKDIHFPTNRWYWY